MKKSLILLMAVLLALSWYMALGSGSEAEAKYQQAMENAASFEERELYLDAIEQYEAAMENHEDNAPIMLRIAEIYRKLGEDNSYLEELKEVVSRYGPLESAVSQIYDYYIGANRENNAIEYISGLHDSYPEDEVVARYYREVSRNYYQLYYEYQQIGSFLGGYAVYEYEGKKGVIDTAGEVLLKAAYDEIRIPLKTSEGFPVRVANQVYLISEKGYKIAQPETEYQELGILSDKRYLVKQDGKYGYLTEDLEPCTQFQWEDATNYRDGIAAVKSGGKWAFINKKGEFLTEYIYLDVKRDEQNFCSGQGRIWVQDATGYHLLDTELKEVSQDTYEDVRFFASEQPCAVCKDGKWGFLNTNGELILTCQYEEADSFSIGYAPVKKDGLWGYLGLDGTMLIEPAFDEVKGFNQNGTAPVRIGESWVLIQLGIYR